MEENRSTLQHSFPPNPHPYYPWLVYWTGEGAEETQNFCTISDPTTIYTRRIPELLRPAATLWTHQHGWYLCGDVEESTAEMFLWNPSNLTKVELPPLELNNDIVIRYYVLISSPTATGQVVISSIFLFSDSFSTSIFYWYLGDKQWTQVDFRQQLISAAAMEGLQFDEDLINLSTPFYYNGCLYAEASTSNHLLVEIKKLEPTGLQIFSSHVFAPYRSRDLNWTCEILESNNELFRIRISHANDKVIAVAIHKLDLSTRVWHKMESIKDRVFFISIPISGGSSFVCQAINPEIEGGRVYIAVPKHNFVYIYNIQDKNLMISQPFLNLPQDQRSHSTWFMSDLRMIGSIKEDIGKSQIREKENNDEIHSKMADVTITDSKFALPLDMVEVIAKHITIGIDYLHFRAANKLFRSSAPLIRRRSSSPALSVSRFDHLSLSPLFVYFEKGNVLTFVYPMNGLKYKYNITLTMVDPQQDCEICYSKDGWLLMVVNKRSSFFFNPFANEQERRLADGPDDKLLNTWCIAFSHPPTSSQCVVVELESYPSQVFGHVTYPGQNRWTRIHFADLNFPFYNTSPVFRKGAFYYLNDEGKLGILKVAEGEDRQEVAADLGEVDNLCAPCTDYYNCFLVECNDDLLSVFEGYFGKWIRVFKLDESTMTWIEVENLENHMLFVGHTSFSAVAHVPGMENKIYFPKFYMDNIVFYSLETKKYHTLGSNEVVNFHDMKEHVNSSWIEPRWH
ncbi:hypothetical protein OROGR_017052 [Orobanche gracilis]